MQVLRHAVADDLVRKQAPADFSRRAGYVFLAVLAVVVAAAGLWLVDGGTRKDLLPRHPVEFGPGFYAEEHHQDTRWRWMGEEGVIHLLNAKQPMVLKIVGRVPKDRLKELPTMTIELNGETLEQFAGSTIDQARESVISAAQQGNDEYSELRIRTNMTVVPKEFDKKSTDARKLGFKLHELTWRPQEEPVK